ESEKYAKDVDFLHSKNADYSMIKHQMDTCEVSYQHITIVKLGLN
ncbi:26865_t:CDS:2, partial [Gigaspora margarita]